MKLFIIGDSTAAAKTNDKRPEAGWGEYISNYLFDVDVINAAINGRSTKSFIDEAHFEKLQKQFLPGDVLIIQFGHNDSKLDDESRFTEPFTNYQKNLSYFCQQAYINQVTPIILSSVPRRVFLAKKKLHSSAVGLYPLSAKAYAKRGKIEFVDAYKHVKRLFEYLGDEKSRKLFLQLPPNTHQNYLEGIEDNTHFNELGARVVASVIAEQLYRQKTALAGYVRLDNLLSKVEVLRLINAQK